MAGGNSLSFSQANASPLNNPNGMQIVCLRAVQRDREIV